MRVFLGLGSNMGDREHNLQTALQALSQKNRAGKSVFLV